MKTLVSRNGKVNAKLIRHATSFDFAPSPYVVGGNPAGSLRWSNFFNALNADTNTYTGVNGPNATLSFTASQTTTVITATTNVFAASDIGRLVVFDSGEYGFITAYTSPTQVTVDTNQSVASAVARIMSVFGRGAGQNRCTLIAVVRPTYITNTDNKIPHLAGYRSKKSGGPWYGIYHNNTRTSNDLNGFNQYRGFNAIGSLGTNLASSSIDLKANLNSEGWHIVGLTQDGTTIGSFIDGAYRTATKADAPELGINCLGFPFAVYSTPSTNPDLDYLTSSIGWSMGRVAMVMAFSRVLTQQELLDLYGMLKYGEGYAISREGLECWLLARRDSEITADRTTLQTYTAFNVPRTRLPDLSGRGRAARLYSDKADWTALMGGTDSDPGIYIPYQWIDENFVYDGTNNYTKNIMTLNSVGAPTFS